MSTALTINQEKQIRNLRNLRDREAEHQFPANVILDNYRELAKQVSLYRRAQKLQTKEAAELRKDLLLQIDACLEKLGVQ
jgi:hypothetical protein